MIRAAIVGLGRWGRTLVNSVQGTSNAIRFTAACTRTRASAETFCAENAIALKDDLDEILCDPAIDGVVFATPHSQHGAQVERTAAAGKHILMEKPFTLDVVSAKAALDAVARAGVVLGVAYPRRFHPAMNELKGRIADGRLGILSHCQSEQTAPAGLSMRADYWRSDLFAFRRLGRVLPSRLACLCLSASARAAASTAAGRASGSSHALSSHPWA